MNELLSLGLVYNASLLLAMVLVFDLATMRLKKNLLVRKLLVGILLGTIGFAIMTINWELIPGVVFDTRSVLLCITGLYFGWIPTMVALLFTSAYRIYSGGSGVLMGVPVIIVSCLIGLVWRAFRVRSLYKLSLIELYVFGLLVHLAMLLCTRLLPADIRDTVLAEIWLPVITIYPVATMILGTLMSGRLRRDYTEVELRESQEKYKALVEQAADGIFILDKAGNFLLTNAKFAEMSGYSEEEIKRINIIDTYVSEERADGKRRLAMLVSGADLEFSRKLLKKDGSVIIIDASVTKLSDGRLQAFVRDVTEKHKEEKELRESEYRFAQIFKYGPQISSIASIDEGRYVDVNDVFLETFGYKKDEVVGKLVADLGIWVEGFNKDGLADKLKSIKVISNRERKFRKSDGQVITCLCSMTKISLKDKEYFLMLGVNIEDRKRAEQELKSTNTDLLAEKSKLEAILRDMGDAVFVTDDVKRIILANKAMEALFGLTEKDMLGKNIDEVLVMSYETSGKGPDDLIKNVFEKKIEARPVETLVVKNKKGTSITVDGVASPIVDENRNLIGTVWLLRDVTKQKELEKMRSDFISLASHQLRTPLTGIKWFVELLYENASKMPIEKVQEYVRKIGDSNNRMIDLVGDLITTSRADSGKLPKEIESYKIGDLLQQAIDEQGRIFLDKNITIEGMPLIPDDIKIDADMVQMVQVFDNIFNNAVSYSPAGSRIEVGAELGMGTVKISVRDHGIGIPLDQQNKVFGKFYRASNVAKTIPGSGLGLYVAKSIVENHGGKIWFESKENLGTTFFVELPIKQKYG